MEVVYPRCCGLDVSPRPVANFGDTAPRPPSRKTFGHATSWEAGSRILSGGRWPESGETPAKTC
jgi:hypothetical protein